MKYIAAALALAVALFPAGAFAGCPDQNGPYFCCGTGWYTFTFDTSCPTTSGNVAATTMWCYGSPAYQWNYGSGSVDYTMTVPAGMDGNNWSVSIYAEFSDPHAYSGDAVSATVYVYHNGSVTYAQNFFIHQGDQGSLSCSLYGSNAFSVVGGDTIEVYMGGQNYYSDATMQITTPTIFSN
jgi:hypothetical protein